MVDEFEIINNPHIKYLNIFLVNMNYRSPHLHRELEIVLILNGNVIITSKHESYNFHQGDTVIFNQNQPHEIKSLDDDALMICLQVAPKFCHNYFPNMSNLVFDSFNIKQNVSNENFKYIQSLIIELAYLYYEKRNGYEFSCMSILNLLFSIFLNNLPYHMISDEEKLANTQKIKRLNKILNYIDENYMHKLSLSDISEIENLSISYLSHFIKDNLNQSFQEYVNNRRFDQAKELLLNKNMKLIDVCLACGFSDYRYLYKVFRKNYNCTPTEYRNIYAQIPLKTKPISDLSHEYFYNEEDTLHTLKKFMEKV